MGIKMSSSPAVVSSSGVSLSHNGTLADSDFAPITHPTRKANILIYGAEKTGKTTFVTRYAPCPIMVESFDGRSDDAVFEAQEMGRDVRVVNLLMPGHTMSIEETKKEAQSLLDRAVRNAEIAVMESKRGNVNTIFFDGMQQFAEICKLAFDGTMEKVKAHSHGEDLHFANRQLWRLANLTRKSRSIHTIFSAKSVEIWKDQKPTGIFKMQGPKAVLDAVDWGGEIRRKTTFGIPKQDFEIEIKIAGTNNEEFGKVYDAEQWDKLGGPFVYACCMNYKDSTPDDWR